MKMRSSVNNFFYSLGLALTAWALGCGGGGSSDSGPAAFAPIFTSQPADQSVTAGQTASFMVVASGTPAPTFQWQRSSDGGATWAGVTSGTGGTTASYTTAATAVSDNAAMFRAVAANSAGSVSSSAATLTVTTAVSAPTFTSQPADQSVTAGQTASFTVVASGTPAPTLQWQRSNDGGATWADVTAGTGGTTASYTTATTAISDNAAKFRAVAANSAGSVSSSAATLTVSSVAQAPAISVQPGNAVVAAGGSASFAVTASGTGLTYQWQVNSGSGFSNLTNAGAYSGATTATLGITGAAMGMNGYLYRVIVTGTAAPAATSSSAALVVYVPGTLTASVIPQQFLQTTKQGTIAASVSGGIPPYTYSWSKDGTALTANTGASVTIPSLALADQGVYSVTVLDSKGAKVSKSSNLFVATTADMPTNLNPVGVAISGNKIYLTSPAQGVLALNRLSGISQMVAVSGGPTGIALDAAGNPWVTLNTAGQVARIDQATLAITPWSVGGQPYGITTDPSGNLWFTIQGTDQVGMLPAGGGTPTLYGLSARATPAGICVDAQGTVWFTERNLGRVGRITSGSAQVEEWGCAHDNAQPDQILAYGGRVFYTDRNSAAVVELSQAAQSAGSAIRTAEEMATVRARETARARTSSPAALPAVVSDGTLNAAYAYGLDQHGGPAGIALDPSGYVWLTQKDIGKVTRLTPGDGTIYTYTLPSSQSQPSNIALGSDGTVWATLPAVNQIAQIPPAPLNIKVAINSSTSSPAQEPRRMLKGEVQAFTATVTGATDPSVTWELLEGAPAGTITQGGVFTATTSPGIYHVIARSNQDPSKFGRLEVVVYPWTAWPKGQLTMFAGDVNGAGNIDGTGTLARFHNPFGLAVDASGYVYVADEQNHTIRMITPAGLVSTIAGSPSVHGAADGASVDARFYMPDGVAIGPSGHLYVADTTNLTIREVTPSGVSTLAGLARQQGTSDGTGSAARFALPVAIAVDSAGNAYVADEYACAIRKITPTGTVSTLAGVPGRPGFTNGPGNAALFDLPKGVAVDSANNVYVADCGNCLIRKITPAGIVSTFAGSGAYGTADGPGTTAQFENPTGVAVDAAGYVYVADWAETIRKITPGGTVSTLAGTPNVMGSSDGQGSAARFSTPTSLGVDGSGNIYVADYDNSTIRKITPGGLVSTFAGMAGLSGSTDAAGSAARFCAPKGAAVDAAGNIYTADFNNFTIRKTTPAGVVSTFAGLAGQSGSIDGAGSAARFSLPMDVALDAGGNLYVADFGNETIRKITSAGVVSTLAGSAGLTGSTDGQGGAARFWGPAAVAVDASGTVYVSDSNNYTIRRITAAGQVSTFAGVVGQSGSADGLGSAARIGRPWGLGVDSAGNVYVNDYFNHTLRKITPAGLVTTLAGLNGVYGSADGPATAARFQFSVSGSGMALDAAGNIYIADADGNAIRCVTPGGFVGTILGDIASGKNRAGSLRDDVDLPLPSSYGALSIPMGVALAPDGSLYVTTANGIMKVTFTP